MATNDLISPAGLPQLTENLSEQPTEEELDETVRDAEVDGNGRIDQRSFRQDASARNLAAKEVVEAFVKNCS